PSLYTHPTLPVALPICTDHRLEHPSLAFREHVAAHHPASPSLRPNRLTKNVAPPPEPRQAAPRAPHRASSRGSDGTVPIPISDRSEEHTSELQSRKHLV